MIISNIFLFLLLFYFSSWSFPEQPESTSQPVSLPREEQVSEADHDRGSTHNSIS